MAIRVTLECGHASMLRVRTTPEGYTHDWEIFVRGVDNADIQQYVEKVVFHLHETFPKPKRVLKEPPFVIKESGYAGFVLPIHVYLKNKDEPKKFIIFYDLELQPRGPAINNVIRHTEIIANPSDEFRRKLIKGGAVVVSITEGSSEKSESKTPTMVGKPKLSGSETKKHKIVESKTSNSFAELFGTPLKPTKVSQEAKKVTPSEKSSTPKPLITSEKSDKIDKSKIKDISHKDNKKEKIDDKKDKKIKDLSKEKNRSKEKSKRPSSPGSKSHSSPATKRPPSPTPPKRPPSPSLPPPKRFSPPKVKDKEVKKPAPEKEKDKEKEKLKDASKSVLDSSKSEKRKDKKKHKEDRDKERKDKYKESERSAPKEIPKPPSEKKTDKPEKTEKPEKEKSQEYKSAKDGRKSPKPPKEPEKPKEEKLVKLDKPEKSDKSDKTKDGKTEKERQKHKHKKREKKDKRDSSKEREKKEKRERIKVSTEKQNNVPSVPLTNPLSLLEEMRERESSDSAPSVDDDSFSEPKLVSTVKKEIESTQLVPNAATEMAKPISLGVSADMKKEKLDRNKREKPKGSRGEDREGRKRKRRSESKGEDEHPAKRDKDRGHSTSPPLEPVSSSQSPVVVDGEGVHAKEKEDRSIVEQMPEKENEPDSVEQVAPDSTNSTLVDSDVGEPPVFSQDYVSQLKDLQQKIMTLQDNQELQRVVQVIAETGQYEITKKTFDFDLCALDRRTVQRLQQFFSAS